ncbi:MAG: tRNA (N6-isopentenyl adenosine(37)-C2)-methylthiotransferase MiaB [Holosporaceae bacterium]|jgi:tRNA-2-methylthio-N6-dimethylallyladenosine synthase|nr:tRNA (N6-isopentenyl adenosine(37)-C2)-methylthiotransferase MiaB [Holosporaceae bacterium]
MLRFFIKNYGCQMNSYDSLRISDALTNEKYVRTDEITEANIVIFNTCSIREKADDKLFSDLGRARLLKSQAQSANVDFVVVVTGCVAQLQSERLREKAPYVDIIIGPREIHRVAQCLDDVLQRRSPTSTLTNLETQDKFAAGVSDGNDNALERGVSAFLSIQEGCDNFCSYCVVPHARGREFSRDANDILAEARQLLSTGTKEIVLLGQNVNSYRGTGLDGKTWNLSRLLYAMADLDGLKRLRYSTSHPKDVDESIAVAHGEINILAPSLHLPVQSGSDDVLKRMNRKYSRSDYLKCIDLLKSRRPDMAFSSDFIVGFPGETENDFLNTLELVEKVRFSQAYSFKYSPRPGTAAEKMPEQILEKIKSERLAILQETLNRHQNKFNESCLGKYLEVLVVKRGRHKNQWAGRSEYSQAVAICDSFLTVGDMARVKITGLLPHSLIGVVEQ